MGSAVNDPRGESGERIARTQRELGEALGVSKTAVQKWLKRTDWPFAAPPWPVEKVDAWRQGFFRKPTGGRTRPDALMVVMAPVPAEAEKPATRAPKVDAEDDEEDLFHAKNHRMLDEQIKQERARKLRLEADRLAAQQSELVSREELNDCLRRLADVFVGVLTELEEALPLALQGLDAIAMEGVLADRFDEVRSRLVGVAEGTVTSLRVPRGPGRKSAAEQ